MPHHDTKSYADDAFNYLAAFWKQQAEWSQATFGPDAVRGPLGPTKHLAREVLTELLEVPRADVDAVLAKGLTAPRPQGLSMEDLSEYVDCALLVIDAARRAGYTCEQFTRKLFEKLQENKLRSWPPFDPAKVNEEREHVREKHFDDGSYYYCAAGHHWSGWFLNDNYPGERGCPTCAGELTEVAPQSM